MEDYCTEELFIRNVSEHQVEVLKDDGLYRHLRFAKPGTRCMSFDLVTWPGYLCFCGDMGEFVFSRTADMLSFFRGSGHRNDNHPTLAVNFGYWAEKCLAADKGKGVKEYAPDKFREVVKDILDDDEDATEELREAVNDCVLCAADDGPHAAHETAAAFEWDGLEYFTDFWEYSLDVYTFRFLWCCYAIAWGIQQYDNRFMAKPWRCNVLNCGNGECVHELTDEQCPHCKHRMVRVKPTGFMFCSNPSDLVCDYEDSRRMQ